MMALASSDFGRRLSVGTDMFCTSKKGGGGHAGIFKNAVHMAAALADCRMALVGTGWTTSHPVSTNRCRNHSSPLVGVPFLVL